MWVPLLDLKTLGWFGGFRSARSESLAIGKEASAYCWTVLRGFAVTVEEIEFVWCGWCLRRHFIVFCGWQWQLVLILFFCGL